MSRGLGKIQRKILQHLRDRIRNREWYTNDWESIDAIIVHVFHPENVKPNGDIWDWRCEYSESQSVQRAIHTLKRRGLVETERHRTMGYEHLGSPGGRTVRLMVKLSVDTNH